jgi:hypothetical protein
MFLKNKQNQYIYGLTKIWSNFNHSKAHNYQVANVFKERILHMSSFHITSTH